MKRHVLRMAFVVGSFTLAATARADDERWMDPLRTSVSQAYGVKEISFKSGLKTVFSGNEIQVTSPILQVRIDGIRVEPEKGGAYVQNTIRDGQVVKSGRGMRGLLAGCDNPARRSLKVGERVQIFRIEIDDDLVRLFVITTDPESVMIRGNTVNTRFFGAILLPFGESAMPTVTTEQVAAALQPVLASGQDVATAATKTVALGQSMDEVKRVLGAPDKAIDLQTKVTWVYKDLKVIFVGGKVADVL